MQKRKVAVIGTTGLPAKYGGFETLVHNITTNLSEEFDFTVYCSSRYFGGRRKRLKSFNNCRLKYIPLNANGIQSIVYDFISLIHALRYADVLLVLGVSGALLIPFIKLFTSKPVIVNIDGQEWKRPKWNRATQMFLQFSEACAVRFADTVITDNKSIQDYVSAVYRKESVMIAYGGDHVKRQFITEAISKKYPFTANPYAFTVCRIEPENNIHLILDAYSQMPEKQLVVVGLWTHGTFGINLRQRYSTFPNIMLLDPIYDQDELNILRSNAALYIHGHSAGGTNPSLVEAMCLGLPVFAYDVCYNRVTTKDLALFFSSAGELKNLVVETDIPTLEAIGRRMEALALVRYVWKDICNAYKTELEAVFPEKEKTYAVVQECVNENAGSIRSKKEASTFYQHA